MGLLALSLKKQGGAMVHADLRRLSQPLASMDRSQVQLALAIADDPLVRSLLTGCTPALARPQQLGQVRLTVGIPTAVGTMIDGVLEYEQIGCVLAPEIPPEVAASEQRQLPALDRCRGQLQTLGWRINLADAIALLSHGGFDEGAIERILHLPWDGWHRSWWYPLSAQGQRELPFQRWFRSRSYGDGTYTLQYRDHYAQDAPPCFRGVWQRLAVTIAQSQETFGETLMRIRAAQDHLQNERALLLCDRLSPLEEEGFMRQGISLYKLQAEAS
jgi:hypothetical protein